MKVLRVAWLQMRSSSDVAENIKALKSLTREAVGKGALYVQSPEMTGLLQKNPKKLLETITFQKDDPVFSACQDLAKEHGIWFHLGSTPMKTVRSKALNKAVNRGAVFSPKGDLVVTYDKIHMFDVVLDEQNMWMESNRFEPGSKTHVVDLGRIKAGLSICYDIRFPQLYRQQAKLGAQLLTCPSSFTVPTGKAHWEILLRCRAIENGAFMVAAAQGGDHEDGRKTYGHSMIVNPWGEIIGQLAHDDPGVLVCDLDADQSDEARKRIPNLANERKFSISMIAE